MLSLLRHLRPADYVGEDTPSVRRVRYGIDCIQPGLFGQVVGVVGFFSVPTPWVAAFWLCVVLTILSTILLLIGCRRNAWMKGHRPVVGVALGLLSFPGVMMLFLLSDRGSHIDRRRGFDVLLPKKVTSTWVTEEALTDPRLQPRPWGSDEDRATVWRKQDAE